MTDKINIAVAKGDGIGSEIMDAVLYIFNEMKIPLEYNVIDMGKNIFEQGHKLGMTKEAKEKVEELGILFKGPMETPKGKGNKSINVTARKMWATYANCREFRTLPAVETIYSKANIPINLTIIRENVEDTYGGVEHLINSDLAISRRFISAPGSYQIHKYAFEYAKKQGFKTVTCGHKANIMKITDGLFLETFYEVAKDYPEIKSNDLIVDDLCMKLVTIPNQFEVIVLPNLQGDIVSDLCAGLIGGLGFAPSANIGDNINIFEAVHGTAPDIAGQNKANPTALLLSGLMMLNHLGFHLEAKKIELAILETLGNKIHTGDLKISNSPVSTMDYAKSIAQRAKEIKDSDERLVDIKNEENPAILKKKEAPTQPEILTRRKLQEKIVGVDVFIESNEKLDKIVKKAKSIDLKDYELEVISNRGIGIYPEYSIYSQCINSYILRFKTNKIKKEVDLLELGIVISKHFKFLSLEILKDYDDKTGYSII